jgi:hypothetical protein
MSPIIDLQRRMVEVGRIRAGERDERGNPRKLDRWRLTSRDPVRLERAAELWGGEVRDWEGHPGEWELYTETDALPIMLIPGQAPTTWYELWSKGGCQRRCDGQHEIISDSACLCGEERECKPTTRLAVILPDLPGLGSWLVSSTGWNAAAELVGAAEILQRATAQGVLIPARLRLEQRVQVRAGQTMRFAVPVIDIDVSMRELVGAQGPLAAAESRALPAGYTPLERSNGGVSLEQGLAEVVRQEPPRSSRSAAPIPRAPADPPFGGPIPVDELRAEPSVQPTAERSVGNTVARSTRSRRRTDAQARKLDVLVGRLREAGRIETRHLWSAVARERETDVELLIAELGGEDSSGLHWAPLREALTRQEAASLIDRLEKLGG